MPYEGNHDSTVDFTEQLLIIENLVNNNSDCHTIIGGDFNVDFIRDRLFSAALTDFCEHIGLHPVIQHNFCNSDFIYRAIMKRCSVLDHFLLTSGIFDTAVKSAYVIHEVDNTSDHDPIILHLDLQVQHLNTFKRIHTPTHLGLRPRMRTS